MKYINKNIILAVIISILCYVCYSIPANALTLKSNSNIGAGGLNSGLVGWWTFDGKDVVNGVARDMSGQGNHGNLTNIATSTFYNAGKIGQGFNFDGVNDCVTNSSGPAVSSDSRTMAFWLNTAENQNFSTWFDLGALNANSSRVQVSSNKLYYVPANSISAIESDVNVSDKKWHHVVVGDSSSTNHFIYIDGVLKATDTTSLTPFTTNRVGIGCRFWQGAESWADGLIDDVRVYNRALSAAEVLQLYNQGAGAKQNATPKEPLNSGLVGWWTFDGKDVVSGVARDMSGQGNHGNLTNIATSTFYNAGKIGQGFNFDGVNDYVDMKSLTGETNFSDTTFTVTGWFKTNVSSAGVLLSKAASQGGWVVRITSGSLNTFTKDSGDNIVVQRSSSSSVINNKWNHFVVVFTTSTATNGGNTTQIYINGVLDQGSLSSGTGVYATTATAVMAGRRTIGNYFTGSLDDVRIYNRALSAAEVLQLYNQGAGAKQNATSKESLKSNLLLHWTFDGKDIVNGRIKDKSGNGYDGVITNIATTTFYTIGKLGQAVNFDGINDCVRTVSTVSFNTKIMTTSLWVKMPTNTGSAALLLEHTTNWNNTDGSFKLETGNASSLVSPGIQDSTTGTKNRVEQFTAPSAKVWHHWALIYDNSTTAGEITIYLDGSPVSSSILAATKDQNNNFATDTLYMGSRACSTTAPWKGSVDDFRIYNRALSATEVLQLYNMGK